MKHPSSLPNIWSNAMHDLTARDLAPVPVAHLHRIHAQEIHDMNMKILQEQLAAEKSFWEEKERLLRSESRDKFESAEEIKDAELKSIIALHDTKAQHRQEKRTLELDRIPEYQDQRIQFMREDYEAHEVCQSELHELKKANLLESDDDLDEEVEDEEEEENEKEDSPIPAMPAYLDIEYERCMVDGSRKRQRLMFDEPI
jgi:hypothetical protein